MCGSDKGSDGDGMDEIILKPTAPHPRAVGAGAVRTAVALVVL